MSKIEKNYQEFWREIIEPEGKIDIQQVKKELSDYKFLLEEVPKVYHKITGCLSKTHYPSNVILSLHEERFVEKGVMEDEILYLIKKLENQPKKKLIKAIKEYCGVFMA